ncbi:MAG: GNAT family N-acetyltransferase [Pseudomonadota bacterium]
MADGDLNDTLTLSTTESIRSIPSSTWQSLAHNSNRNPFTQFAFLSALENSHSVGERAGWIPRHLTLTRGDDIVGVAPAYLKLHSQGEYIFDHHWADAYERAGGRYFPKFLLAAPFTPATSPRILATDDKARSLLAASSVDVAQQIGLSSMHVNFLGAEEDKCFAEAGLLARQTTQYHWFNRDYGTFDDYLAALSSRKRKAVKRERRQAAESGLAIMALSGSEMEEKHWRAFWRFYQDTGMRKWGTPYLTKGFFDEIAETMADQIVFFVAEKSGVPIAGALNFVSDDCLYGRYWGCTEYAPFLHFELCYYQAIEYAITHGLSRVEAGAQGEHKIARGYDPTPVRSRHWIADPSFRQAIARYLEQERQQNAAEIDHLAAYAPYKQSDPTIQSQGDPED